ncbi:hypothetical protein IHQ71_04270 [Rhizobium sp. TH2]|uniref:hypothetical protein n=1 Tax=Rhizobium sp. TH2 TaxID=2775403 RepID=UPI002158774B|nr:hypothetical protein [Rhizobium sp. TH2]UVC09836.1 hypothetical protein IHQ71_04270 [Rhizobium sp. TH2]
MSTPEEPDTLRSIIDYRQKRGKSTYETIQVYGEKYAPETFAHAPIRETLSREHRLRKEIAARRARGQPLIPEFSHMSKVPKWELPAYESYFQELQALIDAGA